MIARPALTLALLLGLLRCAVATPLTVHLPSTSDVPLSFSASTDTFVLRCGTVHEAQSLKWSLAKGRSGDGVRQQGATWVCTIGPLRPGDNLVTLLATAPGGRTWSKQVLVVCNPGVSFVLDLDATPPTVPLSGGAVSFWAEVAGIGLSDLDLRRGEIEEVDAQGRRIATVAPLQQKPGPHGAIRLEATATLQAGPPATRYYRLVVPTKGQPLRSTLAPVSSGGTRPADPVGLPGVLQRAYDESLRAGQSHQAAIRAALEVARKHPDVTSAELDDDGMGIIYVLKTGAREMFTPPQPGLR